ncbi:hypothetical protein K474DRAFT_1659061 [Panus rudis PR-1116 ss-1]|nr:hypothetical protein K474DRAFT_1659061 [Panus rudis PR-1116 ss-1]
MTHHEDSSTYQAHALYTKPACTILSLVLPMLQSLSLYFCFAYFLTLVLQFALYQCFLRSSLSNYRIQLIRNLLAPKISFMIIAAFLLSCCHSTSYVPHYTLFFDPPLGGAMRPITIDCTLF